MVWFHHNHWGRVVPDVTTAPEIRFPAGEAVGEESFPGVESLGAPHPHAACYAYHKRHDNL